MIDFVLVPETIQVMRIQVIGHMPIRTDHRMIIAELQVPRKQEVHPIGLLPRPASVKLKVNEEKRWATFTKAHHLWSTHWEPHDRLPMTEWTEKTLEILCDCLGPPLQGAGVHVGEDVWDNLMSMKRRWAVRNALSDEATGGRNEKGAQDARRALRRRRGAAFAPIASIRDREGNLCEGEALNNELARQMECKQGRAADIFPAEGEEPIGLDFTLEELVEAVRLRQLKTPGKSGFPAAALKQMTMLSLAVLRDVIQRMGRLRYIEPILRFLGHLPIRKVPLVRTEEDTKPIALEEEVAKVIAIMVMARTERHVADRQWAYQAGRAVGEVASVVTMTTEHAEEQGDTVIVYKRDRSNAFGTVDLNGVTHLLQDAGVPPPEARWYQRYVRWARIVSITAAGLTRA